MKPANTHGYTASVWDRLIAPPQASAVNEGAELLSIAQFKQAIARDLEALLNTRVAIPDGELSNLPRCRNSIVNFGLSDFAQLCLTSSVDRKEICERLQAAIERHEPRLCNVRAHLVSVAGMVNQLSFVISAQLRTMAVGERTQFDVKLEPSSL